MGVLQGELVGNKSPYCKNLGIIDWRPHLALGLNGNCFQLGKRDRFFFFFKLIITGMAVLACPGIPRSQTKRWTWVSQVSELGRLLGSSNKSICKGEEIRVPPRIILVPSLCKMSQPRRELGYPGIMRKICVNEYPSQRQHKGGVKYLEISLLVTPKMVQFREARYPENEFRTE